jgi:DNA repair exonuclease SbcCD nuclease subunit
MYKNIIVQTSDIHLCEPYFKYIENPINEFIKYVIEHKPKYVVIAGDYFDRRINSDEKIFSKSIGYLIKIAENCKNLIVINGTYNHDYSTLKILNEIAVIQKNIYFFDKLTSQNIDGEDFLLIPEEYPENPNEYYKNIFNNKYDFIIGHGELEGAKLHSGIDNRKLQGWKFNIHQLESTGAKWNMWGHIHLPQNLSEKTFYSGSLSRYKFGEEEIKGFTVMECDGSKKTFIKINSNLNLITLNEENTSINYDNHDFLKLLNHENTFIRFKGELDSDELKYLQKNSMNEVFTLKNSNKEINSTLENFLLYKNIEELSFEEQFLKMIEKDILKLTKKNKILLENDSFKEKLKILKNHVENFENV